MDINQKYFDEIEKLKEVITKLNDGDRRIIPKNNIDKGDPTFKGKF